MRGMFTKIAVVAFASIAPGASAQVPRDARTPAPTGTGVISGVVMLDDATPQPLRRVRVTVNSSDRTIGRTVITDDSGTFAFRALPGGRYAMAATKEAYVTMQFGAKGYGRQGTPIVLADGQQLAGISIKLPRGAVITGMLLDYDGQPLPGVSVRALRYAFFGGERRLSPGGMSDATTDDRGVYRIYGLSPGEYVVSASAGAGLQSPGDVMLISDADVRRALQDASERVPAVRSAPGLTAASAPAPSDETRRTATYAPVFYPGTTVATQAASVTLAAGEVREGINFQMQLVPTAVVEGVVAAPDGATVDGVTVSMMANAMATSGVPFQGFKNTRVGSDGRFTFSGVMPGQYTLAARGVPGRKPSAGPGGANLWAMSEVPVEGTNISGLTLTLQPGLSISGRLRFEGTTLQPPDPTHVRVMANSVIRSNDVSLAPMPAQADPSGTFTLTGIAPGRYRVTATIAGNRPDGTGWSLKSSTVDDRDTLDNPLELRQSIDDVTITFTDRPSEITGIVRDDRGNAAPEYTVVVFARDSTFWGPDSRRVMAVRPAGDGRFTVRGLPPGDYLIALALDPEQGQTSDPSFLRNLTGSAVPLTLGDSEKKTQDLQVASGTEAR